MDNNALWEMKTKMVQLGNQTYKGEDEKRQFQSFVLQNVHEFDGQAWDMFSNLVTIDPEEMLKDINFWKALWEHLSKVDCNDEKFGFRSGMRIAMIQTVCEEKLNFDKVQL